MTSTVVQRGLFDVPPSEPSVLPAERQKQPEPCPTVDRPLEPRAEPYNEPERSSWEATMADYLSWRY